MSSFKSGFVALIGRPNVGKSTLLNNILKTKVSIISPKPQTTRDLIEGVYTTDNEQIIFVDTPGIHKPIHKLGEFMNSESLSSLADVDLVLYLIDGNMEFGSGDSFIINELKRVNPKTFLVVNKVDLVKNKEKLLENVLKFTKEYDFKEVFYISALNGNNIDLLLKNISSNLEEGPMFFEKDQITNHSESFLISEIIREKVLYLTKEEVPHSVAVVIENKEIDKANPNLLNINATIVCERSSQKKIIIGKNGQMIKQIGIDARKDLCLILGKKIYLELFVRVEEDWRNKNRELKKLGYYQDKDF